MYTNRNMPPAQPLLTSGSQALLRDLLASMDHNETLSKHTNLTTAMGGFLYAFASDPRRSYDYAVRSGARFLLGEDAIVLSPEYSYLYALNVIKGRWEPGEKAILSSSSSLCSSYAVNVLQAPWPSGEKLISKSAADSVSYVNMTKKRFFKAELPISKYAVHSYKYAQALNIRFEAGEKVLSTSGYAADYLILVASLGGDIKSIVTRHPAFLPAFQIISDKYIL